MTETMQCLGAVPLFVIAYVVWCWLNHESDAPVETDDKIIKSDVPGHPEYATQRAAEIVNQRLTGRNLGGKLHVYVSPEQADVHSQSRHIAWMEEQGRAASVGVQVHRVSAADRDRISAMRGSGSQVWHNTAETESGVQITVTKQGQGCGLYIALAVVFSMIAASLYCLYLMFERGLIP